MNSSEKELYTKILEASNRIHEASLKQKANLMVVSAEVAEAIENLDIRKHRKKKLEKINKLWQK